MKLEIWFCSERVVRHAGSSRYTLGVVLAALLALQVSTAASPQSLAECRLRELTKRIALDASPFDKFGWSTALDGDTALTGAINDDDEAFNAGAAYIFDRGGSGASAWLEVQKITAPDGDEEDAFGFAVALDGDLAVVTARLDDDEGVDAGSAYLFERNAGGVDNWGAVKKLFSPESSANAYFGWSAAVRGDLVVIGALFGSSSAGGVYLFARNQGGANQWGLLKQITPSDPAAEDRFGRSVSLNGDTLLVTADGNDDEGSSSGSAYVFERNAGGANEWGQVKKLTASDPSAVDHFGISGAVFENTIVVGAHRDDDNGVDSGSGYVFGRNVGGADNWGHVQKFTASDGAAGDAFGRSVAIAGDTIVASAYAHADAGIRSGAAYVFRRNKGGSNQWGELTKLTASAAKARDDFGWHVAASGIDIVIGAPHPDQATGSDPGSVYFYECRRRMRFIGQPSLAEQSFSVPFTAALPAQPTLRSISLPRLGGNWELELDVPTPGLAAIVIRDGYGAIVSLMVHGFARGLSRVEVPLPNRSLLLGGTFSIEVMIAARDGTRRTNAIPFAIHR